uniref:Protein quiver n=1 Tax=Rhabditophanes sp. KR3021 TaxID=114890 RepID=A0AC35U7R8_9BILA
MFNLCLSNRGQQSTQQSSSSPYQSSQQRATPGQQHTLAGSNSWARRKPLVCLTCDISPGTTFMDGFRISTRLPNPYCQMVPISCNADHDVCATIIMHKEDGSYWMGTGCERSHNFQKVNNCENVQTFIRSVRRGMVSESSALQTVCVCSSNECNGGQTSSQRYLIYNKKLYQLLLPILPLLYHLLRLLFL